MFSPSVCDLKNTILNFEVPTLTYLMSIIDITNLYCSTGVFLLHRNLSTKTGVVAPILKSKSNQTFLRPITIFKTYPNVKKISTKIYVSSFGGDFYN